MRLQEIVDQRVEENKMLWLAQGDTQGFDRGMTQGFDKGSREKALETARRALECGIPVDTVAKFTGLSVDEVASLL